MKTFGKLSLAMILLFSVNAFAQSESSDGGNSGGGSLQREEQPKEAFEYTCRVELNEQTTQNGSTCFSTASTYLKFTSAELNPESVFASITKYTSASGWKSEPRWERCPALPSVREGHMIVLGFVKPKNQPFKTELTIRVTSKHGDRVVQSQAVNTELFTAKNIQTSTGFDDFKTGASNEIVANESQTLTVKCLRTK